MTLAPLPESVHCPGGDRHRAVLMEDRPLRDGAPCGYYECPNGRWWIVARFSDGHLEAQWAHARRPDRHPLLEGFAEDPMSKWNS